MQETGSREERDWNKDGVANCWNGKKVPWIDGETECWRGIILLKRIIIK